ncbi:LysR family transcriptional regulator [Hahella sp. HN01]|uniref:LysR family transcriptional regulator n=1 Tax=Hahella sp. HN01 TaxID=2847262 RepID=UPI001C1ECE89|nr:LysR family transcriptional regulator [Hahella sp. HN01]
MINFHRLDLNLLLTLDVLLTEHNVTRASERLHLSQPSVSIHLAKLREYFDDPLLLPGPRGMRPTARAEELREPLRLALASLAEAVAPTRDFDPSVASHTWRIAASDYSESTVLQPALPGLRELSPDSRLAVLDIVPAMLARQAERGEVDLIFHTTEDAPRGLHQQALFQERYVLVGRAGHTKLKRKPTLNQFCRLEHVIVSKDGGGFYGATDEQLAKSGLERRVVLSVPHFLFLREVIATSDLVAMLPSRLVADNDKYRVVEPPVEIPGFEMSMFWHERSHRDPAHEWLREYFVREVGSTIQ